MSSLYPTLEDMKVDQMAQAQRQVHQTIVQQNQPIQYPSQQSSGAPVYPVQSALYPSLQDYMGLQLTPEMVNQNMPLVAVQDMPVAITSTASGHMQVAPVTGNNAGLQRAEIKAGIRELQLCKDQGGKMGLRVRHVNNGLFVAFVQKDAPAALAGLRFGDQILSINGQAVAGWDNDKAHRILKAAAPEKISIAVRDRPFERTVSMQKDSNGYVGFLFKNGKITSLVKDTSAARNGLLTEHHLIEVNGQNVVGLKDDEIGEIINAGGRTITVTVMPNFIYDHIVKCMGNSIVKKMMDHSIPDL